MTETHNDNTERTEMTNSDDLLSKEKFVAMGWSDDNTDVESGADRVLMIASSLADTGIMEMKEAQAFAFSEIAHIGIQRTAEETGMSPSEIERKLRSARRNVRGARELVEILDDCGC